VRYRCAFVDPGLAPNRRDIREFPVGASAVVFYDPARPERCALKPGVSTSSLFLIAVASLAASGVYRERSPG
jgi:hypothetical protein